MLTFLRQNRSNYYEGMPVIPQDPTLEEIEKFTLDMYGYSSEYASTMYTRAAIDRATFGDVEVIALGCIDERADLPGAFNCLPGSFASILRHAGPYNFGEKYAGAKFQEAIYNANIESKGATLVLPTYHYCDQAPNNEDHLACAAYGGDTAAAAMGTLNERDHINAMYPRRYDKPAFAVAIGVETDRLGLFIHGEKSGEGVDVREFMGLSASEICEKLRPMFPTLSNDPRLNVIAEIAWNNLIVQEDCIHNRRGDVHVTQEGIHHGGRILLYGRPGINFPFNTALEAGPYTSELQIATKVMGGNMKRFEEQGSPRRFVAVAITVNEHPDSHAYTFGYIDPKVRMFARELREELALYEDVLGVEGVGYSVLMLRVDAKTLRVHRVEPVTAQDSDAPVTPFTGKGRKEKRIVKI